MTQITTSDWIVLLFRERKNFMRFSQKHAYKCMVFTNFLVPFYTQWNLDMTKGLRDWQNKFAITRFRSYRGSFLCLLYCYWGKENRSLERGLHYICLGFVKSVPPCPVHILFKILTSGFILKIFLKFRKFQPRLYSYKIYPY